MGLRDLNIDLTKKHVALWKSSKEFMGNVWRPAAMELDKLPDPGEVIAEGSVLWDVLRKTYELGYHGLLTPEEYGGMGADAMSFALITEVMGWAAPDLAVSWGVCTTPFFWAMMSTDPEMQGLVRRFTADREAKMTGCWAITEPDHGSDSLRFDGEYYHVPGLANQVQTVLDGEHYVINGQKSSWVSNGTFASHAALWLSLDSSRRSSEMPGQPSSKTERTRPWPLTGRRGWVAVGSYWMLRRARPMQIQPRKGRGLPPLKTTSLCSVPRVFTWE